MAVIYRIHNKINDKNYIGQSHNWQKRYNHYKSYPFNSKSKAYNRPIESAIRKYGIENFDFIILEEIESSNQKKIDEREKYWIKEFLSLTSEHGYNIELGGIKGENRRSLTYEEALKLSKKYTSSEIKDIQKMLIEDKTYKEIKQKYKINETYLSNINNGVNFKNPLFDYPLKKSFHKSKYTKEEILEIKKMIKDGVYYKDIAKKFKIKSEGFISGINSGKYFFDPEETYPLIIKSCSKKYNKETWVKEIKRELIFTNNTLVSIQKKYNKCKSTVSKINAGRTYKEDKFKYPLRANAEYNKKQF